MTATLFFVSFKLIAIGFLMKAIWRKSWGRPFLEMDRLALGLLLLGENFCLVSGTLLQEAAANNIWLAFGKLAYRFAIFIYLLQFLSFLKVDSFKKLVSPPFILGFVTSLPFVYKFFQIALFSTEFSTVNRGVEFLGLVIVMIGFAIATAVFCTANESNWRFTAAGLIIIQVVGWANRMIYVAHVDTKTYLFEALWMIGIVLLAQGSWKGSQTGSLLQKDDQTFSFKSLPSMSRFIILCAAYGAIIQTLLVSEVTVATIYFVVFFVIAGLVAAALISHLIVRSEGLRDQQISTLKKSNLMAAQAAHDIRSPLAALKVVINAEDMASEQRKQLFSMASKRIEDISDDLLVSFRGGRSLERATQAMVERVQLSSLLEEIWNEKKVQFCKRLDVHFSSGWEALDGVYLELDPKEFQRMLSNLINNAIEALPNFQGAIRLWGTSDSHEIQIVIEDSGVGMSSEVIAKIGQTGNTLGKTNGSGLGLAHAKHYVESMEGLFQVSSILGKGTAISCGFQNPEPKTPKSPPPKPADTLQKLADRPRP